MNFCTVVNVKGILVKVGRRSIVRADRAPYLVTSLALFSCQDGKKCAKQANIWPKMT